MSLEVREKGGSLSFGALRELFPLPATTFFDVAVDGQRFLPLEPDAAPAN